MDKETLISKLNWFYSLELSQVDYYNAESKSVKDKYCSEVFERCSYIEQNHVDKIGAKIKELGVKPTVLGDVISPIIGKTVGELTSLTALEDILTINILLEQKAINHFSTEAQAHRFSKNASNIIGTPSKKAKFIQPHPIKKNNSYSLKAVELKPMPKGRL